MDKLAKLFSSGPLVKIMRLFMFHPDEPFDTDDIAEQINATKKAVSIELKLLSEVGFLKPRTFSKSINAGRGKSKSARLSGQGPGKTKKKKTKGWILDPKFEYLVPLRMLLVNTELMGHGDLKKRLQKTGRVKMIVTSGIFLEDPSGRIDLLVVGDGMNKTALAAAVRSIESIVGTELRYTVFSPSEFEYRLSIRDRLVRDVFDFPHIFAYNTLKNVDIPKESNPETSV